jgi:hypothetical protein
MREGHCYYFVREYGYAIYFRGKKSRLQELNNKN